MGPLPPFPTADVSTGAGLPAGSLRLDGGRLEALQAAAQYLARTHRDSTYPLGPLPSPHDPTLTLATAAQAAGASPNVVSLLGAYAHPAAGSDADLMLQALDSYVAALQVDRVLRLSMSGFPGGLDGYFAVLAKDAAHQPITPAERSAVEARVGGSMTGLIADSLSRAYDAATRAVAQFPPVPSSAAGPHGLPAPVAGQTPPLALRLGALHGPADVLPTLFGTPAVAAPVSAFEPAVRHLARANAYPLAASDLDDLHTYAQALTPQQDAALGSVIEAQAHAVEVAQSTSGQVLPPAVRAHWDQLTPQQRLEVAGASGPMASSPLPAEVQQAVQDVMASIGPAQVPALDDLRAAAQGVMTAAQGLAGIGSLPVAPQSTAAATPNQGILTVPANPVGGLYLLVIGTSGDDTNPYTGVLMIDPAGNDHYTLDPPAPSCFFECLGLTSSVIDVQGDDTYQASCKLNDAAVGASDGGLAVLVDLAGNDLYDVEGCSLALGASSAGLGVLYDSSGDDTYRVSASTAGAATLGSGYLGGAGVFVDQSGNDVYQVEGGASTSTLGSGAFAGSAGLFVDVRGDDQYTVHGVGGTTPTVAFGSGQPIGLLTENQGSFSEFLDASGDDAYHLQGKGFGFGPGDVAVFADTGGNDTYDTTYAARACGVDATLSPCSVGNDKTWLTQQSSIGGCFLICGGVPSVNVGVAGFGIDEDLVDPNAPVSDVQAQITSPRSGAQAALGESVPVQVAAVNTGKTDVTNVQGVVTFTSRSDDATPGQDLGQQQVDFGTVPAGSSVVKTIAWKAPAVTTKAQATLAFAGVADDDAQDNVATLAINAANVPEVTVKDPYVTTSGLVAPGQQVSPHITLENRGNIAYTSLPVTLTFTSSSGNATTTVVKQVELGRPGPYHDPGNAPVTEVVTFDALPAPTAQDTYTVTMRVPSDSNAVDPSQTTISTTVKVVILADLGVAVTPRSYLADPDTFNAGAGATVEVRNLGTLDMPAATVGLTVQEGASKIAVSQNVPALAPDQAVTYAMPQFPGGAQSGHTWTFAAALNEPAPQDHLDNDRAVQAITFLPGIVQAKDFESDDPMVAPAAGDSGWSRGLGPHLPADWPGGPHVWGAGLVQSLPQDTMAVHDLYVRGIDLGQFIDASLSIQQANDDNQGAPTGMNYYGNVGSVAVSPAGANSWQRVEPVGGYPCRNNYSGYFSDSGPGFCGRTPWKAATFDLRAYNGQAIDLRFRDASAMYGTAARGWMVDDVRISGAQRVDGDLQITQLQAPSPALKGQPSPFQVAVRNNGYNGTQPATLVIATQVGNRGASTRLPQVSIPALAPLEVFTATVPWVPTDASLSFYTADLASVADPRPANGHLTGPVTVYDPVEAYDLDSLPTGQPCQGSSCPPSAWSVEADFPSDWTLAPPASSEQPNHAYTGTKVWSTNPNGPYWTNTNGKAPYGGSEVLTAPASKPVANHQPGDKYALLFQHAYDFNGNGYENDAGYVTAKVNGKIVPLAPEGDYPGGIGYFCSCYGSPADKSDTKAWSGTALAYQPVVAALPGVQGGDVIQPRFDVYVNYEASFGSANSHTGWTVDDPTIVRLPRFEHDVSVQVLGPRILDLGKQGDVSVLLTNLGRQPTTSFPVDLTLAMDGHDPVHVTQAVLTSIQPGESRIIHIPVTVPNDAVGPVTLSATQSWQLDQWSLDDFSTINSNVASVLYVNDFEENGGGFVPGAGGGIQLGTRPDGPNIQGDRSWYTGSLGTGSVDLHGPDISLTGPGGLRFPQITFTGQFGFSVMPCEGMYSAATYRLADGKSDETLRMQPAEQYQEYSGYAGFNPSQCSENAIGNPMAFTTDLTSRQDTAPVFEPVFQSHVAYYYSAGTPDTGMEVDDLAVAGNPHRLDVAVGAFTAPTSGTLGPGEDARVSIQVIGAGVGWPSTPVGLRLSTNDRLGPGGSPSLDQVVPVARLHFGELLNVSASWHPDLALDGQVVQLRAQLVRLDGSGLPISDDDATNDVRVLPVAIQSIHRLTLGLRADPNVDPQNVVPVNLQVTVSDPGTRTEDNVRVALHIADLGSSYTRDISFAALQKRPDLVQAPTVLATTWLPPAPGHYLVQATLAYANAALDPSPHTVSTQVHAASLPDRLGDDFDGPDPSASGWHGEDGLAAAGGFKAIDDPTDAQVGRGLLDSGAYEPNARYDYDLSAVLPAGATSSLAFKERHDLGSGDAGLVQASTDDGASWTTLATYTGTAPWSQRSIDLTPLAGHSLLLRLRLEADGAQQGSGWRIDDLTVTAAGVIVAQDGFEDPLGPILQSWDFESTSDQQWTHSGDSSGGATSAIDDWAHGPPGPQADVAPHSGSSFWKTNLDGDYTQPCDPYGYGGPACNSPDNSFGARRLTSPPITVPTGKQQVTMSWWQWLEMFPGNGFCYSYGCYGAAADLASVQVSVDGGAPQPIATDGGYWTHGPNAPGGSGWTGVAGWSQQILDLTPYEGHSVVLTFSLATSPGDFYRWYSYYGPPTLGHEGGWAIDDVRLHAVDAPVTGDDTAITGISVGHVLAQTPTEAVVHLQRSGPDTQATLHLDWVGADGAVLPVEEPDAFPLPTGASDYTVELGGVAAQATRLTATVTSGTDTNAVNDRFDLPVGVLTPILTSSFDGTTACGRTSPCQGWTHAGTGDEWENGPMPSNKFPGAAHTAGGMVFATDLTSDHSYEAYASETLTSPGLDVPAQGARLFYWQALDTKCDYSLCDGGTLTADGTLLTPDGGYTTADCGYYAQDLPCMNGKSGWSPVSVDLSALAGRTNQHLQFTLHSDYYDPGNRAGWMLDDLMVAAPAPHPVDDLALAVPSTVDVDARATQPLSLTVVAQGTGASGAASVLLQWFRDGRSVGPATRTGVPALLSGASAKVLADFPPGPLQGLVLRASLATPAGDPLGDGDPGNDVAQVAIHATRVLAALTPASALNQPAGQGAFAPVAPPPAAGAPSVALVAGFTERLAQDQALEFGPVDVAAGDQLAFRQSLSMSGSADGAWVEGSTDGGRTWQELDPHGGYPALAGGTSAPCTDPTPGSTQRCFTTTDGQWQDVRIPLDGMAGTALLRFVYHTSQKTAHDAGWALADIDVTGPAHLRSALADTRWQVGPLRNHDGPIEEATQPNAWGTGLTGDLARTGTFDVLASRPFDAHAMVDPAVSFDWAGAPVKDGRLLVQARDSLGNWEYVGAITGSTKVWKHAEFDLAGIGDATQVRLVYQVPPTLDGKTPAARPGYFVDDLLVGSLRGKVQVRADALGLAPGDPIPATEATNLTLPVTLSNPGAFTNRYQLEVIGVDPQWVSVPTAPITLGPGRSVQTTVSVLIPYVRDEGSYPLEVVAHSLFDPLQVAHDSVTLKLAVAPKPDYVVKRIDFQSSFRMDGDPRPHLEDAKANTIVAEVENIGRVSGQQDLEVLFLEHLTDGEVRPIDVVLVPRSNLTAPDEDHHSAYAAFVEWFPRKGVDGIEVVANPASVDSPLPTNPESDFHNNRLSVPLVIEPRALPELALAAAPGFSRLPQVGQQVSIGVDVRNSGNAPTTNPVDVAVLADPQDALLDSPVFVLPSNSLAHIDFSSDLELHADGFQVELREGNGPFVRIEPLGGYPNGCLSGLGCKSGVSGRGDHRELTFDLSGHEGPVQLRLRFGMDSHNGRTFDGLQLTRVRIQHFRDTSVDFDFTRASDAWTASPTYTGPDGSPTQLFRYRAQEGVLPGAWTIPTNYLNPYLVAIKAAKPIATGNLEHVDLDWVPAAGGETPLTILVDPKNIEPEFLDDLNLYQTSARVAVSGFAVQTTPQPGCPADTDLCLADAAAVADFPVQLANTGNTRTAFELGLRSHPYLDAKLSINGHAVTRVELDPGGTIAAVLHVRALSSPAGVQRLQLDVTDLLVGRSSLVTVPVQVLGTDAGTPLQLTGDTGFDVVAHATRTLALENPSNRVVQVLLRAGAKPSGLALAIQPSEMTLAPFESRAVSVELLNFGVTPGDYTVPIVNGRTACAAGTEHCGEVAQLAVHVERYAPPESSFDVATLHARPNLPVQFTQHSVATGSTLQDWAWDFGDGSKGTGPTASHTYLRPGLYSVVLVTTDSEGQTGTSAPQVIEVSNDPPVAVLGVSSPVGTTGQALNFSAYGSNDADGGIAKVTWAFGDGALETGLNVTHTYHAPGTYRVTMAIEDIYGTVTLKDLQVQVNDPSAPLVLTAKGTHAAPLPLAALLAIGLLACAAVRRRRA